MYLDLLYELTDASKIPDIEFGCMLNDEQRDAVRNSLKYVSLTISIDDTWGYCKVVQVNGVPLNNNNY